MRGPDDQTSEMFSYLSPEQRVRPDHPLRPIRRSRADCLAFMKVTPLRMRWPPSAVFVRAVDMEDGAVRLGDLELSVVLALHHGGREVVGELKAVPVHAVPEDLLALPEGAEVEVVVDAPARSAPRVQSGRRRLG